MDADERVAELEKQSKTQEENALKGAKAIQGLMYEMNKKVKEVWCRQYCHKLQY